MTDAALAPCRLATRILSVNLALCLLFLSGLAVASGIGGTGSPAVLHEGSGIGGTGSPAVPHEGSGIGGTGSPALPHEGSGIGGTGIVGIITGFGSIWVNGIEVHYGNDALVDTPSGPRRPEALAVGQVVLVASEQRDGRVQARTIQLLPAVAGPVTAIGPAGNRYTVAGQAVEAGSHAVGNRAPRVGDWVSVAGLRRADNTIVASRLTPYPRTAPVLVYGPLSREDNDSPRIEGLPVLLPKGTAAMTPGSHVLVSGSLEDGRLMAREVHDNPVGKLAADAGTVSLQGYVQASQQGQLRIASLDVRFSQAPWAGVPAPAVDQLVQVEAYRDDDGTLTVERIETLSGEMLGLEAIETEPRHSDTADHEDTGTHRESETPEGDSRDSEDTEIERAEAESPEAESPEVESSEVESPEVESPEVESPEVESPEVETPEVETPEVETPEVEVPEVEAPEVEVPEIEAPEVEMPEVEVPETEPPEISLRPFPVAHDLLTVSADEWTELPGFTTTAFSAPSSPFSDLLRATEQPHPLWRS